MTTVLPNDPLVDSGADPLWQRTAEAITAAVTDGRLALGARLPSERELCERLKVSRVTLRRALTELVAIGLLSSVHGRGWFVASRSSSQDWPNALESFTQTARRKGLAVSSLVLRAEVGPASLDQADRLRIAAGVSLFNLERIRLLDGIPVAVDQSYLPLALAPGLVDVDFAAGSLYQALAAAGVVLDLAESALEAQGADALLAERLSIDPGAPVLVLDQLTYDRAMHPVLVSTVRYSGERYRLRTTFKRSG
ncbi:MAG: GntR family transcriptional regulator [Propionibacteriaceae bacterium]|jgi:DNA-binding GntR family transcriptional regulator|nr:GntR family transcriptional regulator [Propionibacteriaceae bacterium]